MAVELNNYTFVHEHDGDSVWWVEAPIERDGVFLFSFDKKTVFNLFADYPWKLTKEQKHIFDKENPFWAEYFKDRK